MLSQAEIDRFHRDGFLIMRQVIGRDELQRLQAATAAVITEGVARRGEHHLYQERADGSEVYWRSERMWDRDAALRAVTVHPTLLENVGQCIGLPFFPWNDSLVVKTPGGEGVGWHQDPPFGEPDRLAPTPAPNFTTDIYLDDSDEDNGCVWAIPGHHLVGHVRLEDFSAEELFSRRGAVPVRMHPGDVLFHALSTPHGSRANASVRQRRTFYIHYIAMAVHRASGYQAHWKPIWDEAKRAELRRMDAERVGFGERSGFGAHAAIGAEGIVLAGCPMTPVDHWSALAAAIPTAARERRRALAGHAQVVPA